MTNIKRPLCLLCLSFVITIAIVMKLYPPPYFSLGQWDGEYVTIQGKVRQKNIKNNILVITLSDVNLNKDSSKQGVLCYMNLSYQPKMGSTVSVTGKAQTFSEGSNPGEFNQLNYQRSNHVDFKLNNAIIKEESVDFNRKEEWLFQLKGKMAFILDKSFSEKNASVMKAMLLGEKGDLDKDVKNLYQKNGIAHILAISGLHISILGMGLYKLLRRILLPIPLAIVISILLIYHYGVMIGMGSSAFRAIFMFGLHLLGIFIKRTYDLLTALALGAVFLLIGNPYFIYHIGFLLSFGAIIGIGLLCPLFTEKYDSIYKKKSKIINAFFSSLSVSLTTFPILLCSYYEFPIYSILLNLCIIPLMSILVIGGIGVLLLGLLTNSTSIILGLPCTIILWLYQQLCTWVQQLPNPTWIIGMPKWWQIVLYYGIMILIIFLGKKLNAKMIIISLSLAIFLLTYNVPKPLSMTILDVGQGDGIFIESHDNTTYLIDAGSTTKKKLATYQLVPFLKYHGVSSLDYVFLTHMDHDHISGVVELLQGNLEGNIGLPIKRIVLSKILMKQSGGKSEISEDKTLKELLTLAKEVGTEIIYMEQGDMIKEKELEITCLHPSSNFQAENANDGSLVLSVSSGEFDMLLTGDVEGKGEDALIDYLKSKAKEGELLDYEVLKVAHHGSKSSSKEELLSLIQAEIGVISCGKNNTYGHPHKEIIERLEANDVKWFSTAEEGAITFEVLGNNKKRIDSDFYSIMRYNKNE